jgi:hypothetical protein
MALGQQQRQQSLSVHLGWYRDVQQLCCRAAVCERCLCRCKDCCLEQRAGKTSAACKCELDTVWWLSTHSALQLAFSHQLVHYCSSAVRLRVLEATGKKLCLHQPGAQGCSLSEHLLCGCVHALVPLGHWARQGSNSPCGQPGDSGCLHQLGELPSGLDSMCSTVCCCYSYVYTWALCQVIMQRWQAGAQLLKIPCAAVVPSSGLFERSGSLTIAVRQSNKLPQGAW